MSSPRSTIALMADLQEKLQTLPQSQDDLEYEELSNRCEDVQTLCSNINKIPGFSCTFYLVELTLEDLRYTMQIIDSSSRFNYTFTFPEERITVDDYSFMYCKVTVF